MKKCLAIILSVCFALCLTACNGAQKAKIIYTGNCGDNITWTYYDDFSLVFSGTGAMHEYYDDIWYQPDNILIPWYPYSSQVQEIVIEEGITSICAFAFIDSKMCKKITIPDSVTKIGYCAFEHWANYDGFILNKTIKSLGAMAFHSCNFNVYYTGTKQDFEMIQKIPPKDPNIGSEDVFDPTTQKYITKPYDWNSKFDGTLLYYSEIQQEGCWRYINGVPTAW